MTLSSVGTAGAASSKPDEHPLPTDVKPVHYDLTMRTDLEKLKFDELSMREAVMEAARMYVPAIRLMSTH